MDSSSSVLSYSDYGLDYSYPEYSNAVPAYLNMDPSSDISMASYSPPSTSTIPPAPLILALSTYPNYSTYYPMDYQYSAFYSTGTYTAATTAYSLGTSIPSTSSSATSMLHLPAPNTTNPKETIKPTENTKSHRCSNCSATESCKWRNVRSKDAILCNPCFTYKRKYNKDRSTRVANAYQVREMKKYKSD